MAASNGEPRPTLPVPARYVIDASGIVRDAQVDPDYTRRPDPAETLAAIDRLPGAGKAG